MSEDSGGEVKTGLSYLISSNLDNTMMQNDAKYSIRSINGDKIIITLIVISVITLFPFYPGLG
jgi:hypothetical protein